ncbi:beta-glucosidase 12-like isoform X1 [Canna indica]|uniref:Beta-glucosidase 12-like isoform X1 n=1 Tax=Canna indica TaxID=4628 RepID=A0AAQ3QS74_9LILI|nr:beta-glucosidase 12-like isoform X1 [Canna indica]
MTALGVFAFLLVLIAAYRVFHVEKEMTEVNRSSFPAGFVFGAASAAYQYEGAASEGGKGPSIWDTFTHFHPEKIADRSTGDVAVDFYHRYKEDIEFLKYMGMDAYRFSISWPRILPNGSLSGGVNKEGIQFYNNLINHLLANGLQPYVTLFHWDLPQALESQYKGFLSPLVVDDFREYAEICFKEFGDRVKHWITFNEPLSFCVNGYSTGLFSPGRIEAQEPYLCAHHQLLAHATTVKLYRDKYQAIIMFNRYRSTVLPIFQFACISAYIYIYIVQFLQATQKGKIGITLVSHWFMPYSENSKADNEAVSRALDFLLGWFMDPLSEGDYPFSMRALVGDRLPKFNPEQSGMVQGSFDFIGLNYYTTYFSRSISLLEQVNISYESDSRTQLSGWIQLALRYPQGFRELLLYIKNKYNNPVIYVTENGVDEVNDESWPLDKALQDEMRIEYHMKHLYFLKEAIREGVDVRGYFAWSLLDNFEWGDGYTVRFGLIYVDYKNGLKRYPKSSASWFRKILLLQG